MNMEMRHCLPAVIAFINHHSKTADKTLKLHNALHRV
jgi:hypothetical protein